MSTNIDIVGVPSPLPEIIPTNRDIVKYVLYRRQKEEIQNFSNSFIINVAVEEILDLYKEKPFVSSVLPKSKVTRLASNTYWIRSYIYLRTYFVWLICVRLNKL